MQPLQGIYCDHFHISGIHANDTLAQGLGSQIELFDQNDFLCSSGSCLHPECTTTGKQVNTSGSTNVGLQPVEQGFPATVAGRPQTRKIRNRQTAATPLTTDDSHRSGSFLFPFCDRFHFLMS